MARRAPGRDKVAQPVGRDRQPDLVLLPADHLRQRRGQVLHVLQLRARGAEPHRVAGVEHQRADEVRLVLVDPGVRPAGAGEHLPVEPAEVLAVGVLAEVGELAGPALAARRVPAAEGALDRPPGGEPQPPQRRQRRQVEEPAVGRGGHAATCFRR